MNAAVAAIPQVAFAKGNPFWEFANRAYAVEDVEKACLALQNRLGLDVNMVLFCVWLAYRGDRGGSLAQHLAGALKLSRDWQSRMIEPLRSCRNNLKEAIETGNISGADKDAALALRERLKTDELELEAMQIMAMASLVAAGDADAGGGDVATQKENAHNNINVYSAAAGVDLDPLAQTHVVRILNGIFE